MRSNTHNAKTQVIRVGEQEMRRLRTKEHLLSREMVPYVSPDKRGVLNRLFFFGNGILRSPVDGSRQGTGLSADMEIEVEGVQLQERLVRDSAN